MFYPENLDPRNFRRLDEVHTTEFLTSMAAALAEHGYIRHSEVQEIKLSLNRLLPEGEGDYEQPLLLRMEQNHSGFLCLLQARFGTLNLMRNLLRHGLSRQLERLMTTLANWGSGLLPKSDLLFNRPFYVYVSERCEQTKLFSTVILDLSEAIEAATRSLMAIYDQANTMLPNSLLTAHPEDQAIDQAIAQHLGFRQILAEGIPLTMEQRLQQAITNTLAELVTTVEGFAAQMAYNQRMNQTTKLFLRCDQLTGYLKQFSALSIPVTADLLTWEAKRISLLAAMHNIYGALEDVVKEFMKTLETYQNLQPAPLNLPQDLVRSMANELIRRGIDATVAMTACKRMLDYSRLHGLAPHEIIPAELSKIDPHLTPETLAVLQQWHNQQDLVQGAHEQKDHNLTRHQQLKKSFKNLQKTAAVTAALLAFIQLPGCGLKGNPRSQEPDFRPEVPYREQAVAPPGAVTEDQDHTELHGDEDSYETAE